MKSGIDTLLDSRERRKPLEGRRAALLGHPASVTKNCRHTLDVLMECPEIRVVSAFGPQHGMRGDKQDNMIESDDYVDPRHKIPVFSLYGEVRYPTDDMMATFDVLLIDLQDIGRVFIPMSQPWLICSKPAPGIRKVSGFLTVRIRQDGRLKVRF